MIKVTYNGVNITNSVSVNRCHHDMYAGGRADTLNLRVNDIDHLWDSWVPAAGDEIRVDSGTESTGTMLLTSVKARNGLFVLAAQSAPQSGFVKHRKAWRQVRLLQLGREIAERNGLEFASYGVADRLYSYILQDNVGDFAFLNHRAMLESCAMQIYNKRLVLYSEPEMEAQQPLETLDIADSGDYEYSPKQGDLYGSCEVSSGVYSGVFSAENGSKRVYRPQTVGVVGSDAEAERFARGLLRAVNKACMRGFVRTGILSGYAAGSVVTLNNALAPSWNGPVFIDHLRNDYVAGKSKIFFRRLLEGF